MRQTHSTNPLYIGAILTCVGGYLDGYSYLLRDGAFATMQTGNMIYTVLNLVGNTPQQGVKYLLSIGAFFVGIMVAIHIKKRMGSFWQQRVLLFEITGLVAVGFIPVGQWNLLANVAMSFLAALQTESFKTMGDNRPYVTTMCTGNLRSCAEQCYQGFSDRQSRIRCLQYLLIIVCFMSGVFFATCMTPVLAEKSIWIGALGLCFPCWVMGTQSAPHQS